MLTLLAGILRIFHKEFLNRICSSKTSHCLELLEITEHTSSSIRKQLIHRITDRIRLCHILYLETVFILKSTEHKFVIWKIRLCHIKKMTNRLIIVLTCHQLNIFQIQIDEVWHTLQIILHFLVHPHHLCFIRDAIISEIIGYIITLWTTETGKSRIPARKSGSICLACHIDVTAILIIIVCYTIVDIAGTHGNCEEGTVSRQLVFSFPLISTRFLKGQIVDSPHIILIHVDNCRQGVTIGDRSLIIGVVKTDFFSSFRLVNARKS